MKEIRCGGQYVHKDGFQLLLLNDETLYEYINVVKKYIKERPSRDYDEKEFASICVGIDQILLIWTGDTYIGIKKDVDTEQQFQRFFTQIRKLLVFCSDNKKRLTEKEASLAEYMIFHGTVYRYLGMADHRNYRKKIKVVPVYNDIYVSWSKSEENSYVVSKFCGPITWMKATIKEPDFGIDIHGFEEWCKKWYGKASFITRGNEREVVFPTIEKYIEEIKYFR